MKILIAEDNKDISWIWKEGLKAKKHTIKIAEDGEAAISTAKSFLPDVILLDLVMPKKDGMTVLKELKADEKVKNIPVIVLSNLGGDESIKQAMSLGAVDYFVKSQHPVYEIIEKVQKYTDK